MLPCIYINNATYFFMGGGGGRGMERELQRPGSSNISYTEQLAEGYSFWVVVLAHFGLKQKTYFRFCIEKERPATGFVFVYFFQRLVDISRDGLYLKSRRRLHAGYWTSNI